MDYLIIYIALVLIGACMGSYAGALVWRLRAQQLADDKKQGEKISEKEFKKLKKISNVKPLQDRSKCLSCDYDLKWYDMVPIISWIQLRGRCRKCHNPIGITEITLELLMALFFASSFMFWPVPLTDFISISQYIIWLMAGVGLAVLFVYDMRWYLLPNVVNFSVIALGTINSLLILISSSDKVTTLTEIVGSVAILAGIYWFVYEISKHEWIGFGDVKLGLGLGLMLADWKLAFLALFSANLVGCILVLPGLVMGKLKRNTHIPFGPLLIVGFVIASLFGQYIINEWYLGLL